MYASIILDALLTGHYPHVIVCVEDWCQVTSIHHDEGETCFTLCS